MKMWISQAQPPPKQTKVIDSKSFISVRSDKIREVNTWFKTLLNQRYRHFYLNESIYLELKKLKEECIGY